MADRTDIRKAVYSEMESAISGLNFIGSDDISQTMPDDSESLPQIVHNDDYREVPMNDASAAHHEETRDKNGFIETVTFYATLQGQFAATVVHDDETEKETIYENLRRQFAKYEHGWWDESDIHSDIHEVNVSDSTSVDSGEREPPSRGDRLLIQIDFLRDYTVARDGLSGNYDGRFDDNIRDVDHLIDADDDGTTDETYTTT